MPMRSTSAAWCVRASACFEQLYRHCADFATSRMYPGIPEYISARGRGMYPYLTGSASWYLLTLVTEVFGVKGELGDLALEPKLVTRAVRSQRRRADNHPLRGPPTDCDLSQSGPSRLWRLHHSAHHARWSRHCSPGKHSTPGLVGARNPGEPGPPYSGGTAGIIRVLSSGGRQLPQSQVQFASLE